MGGIFSSAKEIGLLTEAVGPTLRQKQADEAEARANKRTAEAVRRRRIVGGSGGGSGALPEKLPSPPSTAGGTKLGVE